jgi:predicted MFS family arabinose efflux permease
MEMGLVALLSLHFGILFFDRNALNFLMPFVQPDLGLTNTQVGLLASALSFTWAASGFLIGNYSDRSGKRKSVILAGTVAFCICSVGSGLATSFGLLFLSRLVMGFAEGGVLPISQSLVAREVAPEHRGLAMGVTQNLGSNLLGSAAAPLLLVPLAVAYGWRTSFYLAAIPGLITAVIIYFYVKEPPPAPASERRETLTLRMAFRERNIQLCAVISVLLVSYLVVCWSFMPLFLTQFRHFSNETMGWLMAALGISAGVGSFAVPALSDRIGRRPVLIFFPLLGVILPLGALYFSGSLWVLAAIFFFGWGLNGVFPLFMGTIPSETVDPRHVATALGLVCATGEILGGVLSPFVSGYAADRFGLQAPLWIMFGLCILAGLLAFGLRETAPRVLARRAQAQ